MRGSFTNRVLLRCSGFVGVLLIAIVALLIYAPGQANAYDGARLIDNDVFRNDSSMSLSEIQAFLNTMNSGLKSKSFTFNCTIAGSQSTDLYESAGAPCGQSASAAKIIYYASKVYGINPQVVLASLQKEQSLITTTNPTSWQLNQAMGYACPDSGGCGSSTFFYQIDNGTWVLRWHYERAKGNMTWWRTSTTWTCGTPKNYYKPSLYPGVGTTFYDDNDVAYRTYSIATAATSSLYCYTPHAYNNPNGLYGLPEFGTKGQYYTGSYNFVKSFESWFGSTQGTPFFRTGNNPSVYILGEDNSYYWVPSGDILASYGYGRNINKVETKNSSALSGLTYAGALGVTAKFEDAPVYLMDSGGRHHFQSMELLEGTYGYSGDDVSRLSEASELYFTTGPSVKTIVRERHGAALYLIEGGEKRHFVNWAAYDSGEPSYASLSDMELSDNYLATLPSGSSVFAPGALYKIGNSATVYIVNDFDSSLKVPSKSIFNHFGFSSGQVLSVTTSNVSAYPSSGNLGHFVKSGNIWQIHDGLYRNHITDDPMAGPTKYNLNISTIPTLRPEVIRLYSGRSDLRPDVIRADNDSRVYLVENGTKRWITSKSILDQTYGGSSNVTVLSEEFVDDIGNGANIY